MSRALLSVATALFLLGCPSSPVGNEDGGGGGGGAGGATYTVGGTVTGLTGGGLVLRLNSDTTLPVAASGPFTFPGALPSGAAYAVSVSTQPSAPSQTCTVVAGSGTVGMANVTSVVVNCAADRFTVGGTVSGLATGASVVLANGASTVTVSANGPFALPGTLASGETYAVSVRTQPSNPTQTCTVTSGTGAVARANIDTVVVACVTERFTVGGTVSGLAGSGLILTNSGADDLPVAAGPDGGTFTFATRVPSGQPYRVEVKAQPSQPSQTCTVLGGTGNVGAGNVTSVAVACATDSFPVTAVVTGLTGTGLVLQNNGADDLPVAMNGRATFATQVLSGRAYEVTVKTQPSSPPQTCTVSASAGTVQGVAVDVVVNCEVNTYTVGGTVSGLAAGTTVTLATNGQEARVSANGAFTFSTPIRSGASYDVTVASQPTSPWQTCTVASGTGVVGTANVSSVAVTCTTNRYTLGVTVTGLAGSGLQVRNGTETLSIAAPGAGTFTFPSSILSGATYAVTVVNQPTSPWQTCTVAGASGTMGGSDTTLTVTCTTNTYTLGGTVTGLASGATLVLSNGAATATVNGPATSFTFATGLVSGTTYAVTVSTNPTSPAQTCTVAGGSGTVGGANITSVAVTCTTNTYVINASVVGLSGTIVLRNNGGNDLTLTGSGSTTAGAFSTRIASGASYDVTVFAQPSNFACTVPSPTGTVGASDVTVTVNCSQLYTVGGSVSGLTGSVLVLTNNGGNDLSVAANGNFTFTTLVAGGGAYAVAVKTQPTNPWQTCTVSSGSGTIGSSNVTNVTVSCVVNTYTVGGTVSGLSGTLVLRNNGGNDLTLTSNGSFAFSTALNSGTAYSVTLVSEPATQRCTLSGASGPVINANITSVAVSCVDTFSIGGTISGLVGSGLRLRLNGASTNEVLPTAGTTSFTFPQRLASGTTYSVTVESNPGDYVQSCTLTNFTGLATTNINNVTVSCGSVTRIRITFDGGVGADATSGTSCSSPVASSFGTARFAGQVADVPGFTVRTVRVELQGFTHGWVGDLRAFVNRAFIPDGGTALVDGGTVYLFANAGDCMGADVDGGYNFFDTATGQFNAPSGFFGLVDAGDYYPTTFMATRTALSDGGYSGVGPQGTWSLTVQDVFGGFAGRLSGWVLDLTP